MQVQSKLTRPGGTKIEVNGKEYHFQKNEQGEEVCEVKDEYALHRLVNEIPLGFCLHGDDAGKKVPRPAKDAAAGHPLDAKKGANKKPAEPETLIVEKPDGEKVDLMLMEKAELAAFAQAEFAIEVHAKWKEADIRTKILEAIRIANADE